MKTKPKYKKHNCDSCKFLGKFAYLMPAGSEPVKTVVDLYVCHKTGTNTILVRTGNNGSSFTSASTGFIRGHIMKWLMQPQTHSLPKIQGYIRALARGHAVD